MLVRLALETRAHHAQADADRLAVMDAKTGADYRTFLARVFGLEAQVETFVSGVEELDQRLVRARSKVGRLRRDLVALGMTEQEIATLPMARIAPVRLVPHALAWMFVIERQTLLFGLLRRHLARVIPAEMAAASEYLSVYGDAPGARFRELGEAIADNARRYTPQSIVSAAGDAFRTQRHWYMSPGERILATGRNRDTADELLANAATLKPASTG